MKTVIAHIILLPVYWVGIVGFIITAPITIPMLIFAWAIRRTAYR